MKIARSIIYRLTAFAALAVCTSAAHAEILWMPKDPYIVENQAYLQLLTNPLLASMSKEAACEQTILNLIKPHNGALTLISAPVVGPVTFQSLNYDATYRFYRANCIALVSSRPGDQSQIWDVMFGDEPVNAPQNKDLLLNINAVQPMIPSFSGIVQGKVLTQSKLSMALTQNQAPAVGKQVPLASNRGSQVDLIDPNVVLTDANGQATTWVSTRAQPGSSTIAASDATIKTTTPGIVTWLPAKYYSDFLVTCYHIANEAEAPKTPVSEKVCGLPQNKTYRTAFLEQTQIQGSGQALDGTIIHYNGNNCYNPETCARTASGACAVAGTTIAVDPRIIPMKSTVNVGAGIGKRIAQDKGGGIVAYHIDEYLGAVPKTTCDKLGKRYTSVTLINY